MAKKDTPKIDLYQQVTDRIIEALESGNLLPWQKTYSTDFQAAMAYNFVSKKNYRGVNPLLLWLRQEEKGFEHNAWLSYKQAANLGGQVKKGEKGTSVFYFSVFEKENEKTKLTEKIPFLKYYTVFNVSQCDGLEMPEKIVKPPRTWEDSQDIEQVFAATGASLVFDKHHTPCFVPALDYISMPNKSRYTKADDYYKTLFHELTHWTGHNKRLKRDFTGRFGSQSYAFEELVAEIGSAYLCADLGIHGNTNDHASYIDNWLQILKKDKRAIFKAATLAQQAHGFILKSSESDILEEAA
jgi:antirestriction protein ArdC